MQDEDLPKTLEDRRADGRLREKSAELDNVKSFAQAGEIDVGERERAIRAVGVDEAVGEPLGAAGNRRAPGEGYSAAVEARDRVAGGGIAGQTNGDCVPRHHGRLECSAGFWIADFAIGSGESLKGQGNTTLLNGDGERPGTLRIPQRIEHVAAAVVGLAGAEVAGRGEGNALVRPDRHRRLLPAQIHQDVTRLEGGIHTDCLRAAGVAARVQADEQHALAAHLPFIDVERGAGGAVDHVPARVLVVRVDQPRGEIVPLAQGICAARFGEGAAHR